MQLLTQIGLLFITGAIAAQNDSGNQHFDNLKNLKDLNKTVTVDDFNVYYYNWSHPYESEHIIPHTFNGFVSESFRPERKSMLCFHGWHRGQTSRTCQEIKFAAYRRGLNTFIVDYSRLAHELYPVCVMALPELGKMCGNFIEKMLEYYNLDSDSIMLIGHGLGAQLAAYCASNMPGKPREILGLDPVQYLFSASDPENCLNADDAKVVHVLHTNKGYQGFNTSIGHADFYPNGGETQPGCGADFFGYCAHFRAVEYFVESIGSVVGFKSRRCDSYEDYEGALCKNNHMIFFADMDLDNNAKGDYYFNTNARWPFAMTGTQ